MTTEIIATLTLKLKELSKKISDFDSKVESVSSFQQKEIENRFLFTYQKLVEDYQAAIQNIPLPENGKDFDLDLWENFKNNTQKLLDSGEDSRNKNLLSLQNELKELLNSETTKIDEYLTSLKNEINEAFKNNIDTLKGKDGVDGIDGVDGKDATDEQIQIQISNYISKNIKKIKAENGKDGVGIKDITQKGETIIITLTDGRIKKLILPIVTRLGNGGGGISATQVSEMINNAIGGGIDVYTKSETNTLINDAIDNLVNGASNIIDSFGEVESVLTELNTSINANSQAIANLATAQGQFQTSTVQPITTTETILDFNVTIPSTDTNVLNLDGALNRCFFGINASFNFRTDMDFYINHNTPTTVTIRGRNVLDDSIVYERNVLIDQNMHTVKSVSTNTLLTIGKNGFPESDLTIYFTIQGTSNVIDMQGFNSTLTSSSQYDLGTISYTKAETDALIEDAKNLFIQNEVPVLATGKQALWIDTSNGNITFNLVIGD